MHRVKDPSEREKLEAKSRRIFLRIACIVTMVFLGGLMLTMVLLPRLTREEDDGLGPCQGSAAAGLDELLCNLHGSCGPAHSHCTCWLSMYDGVSCDRISFGFVLGAPTAVAAILWLLNLGWILRGGTKPLPTEAELVLLYEELKGVLVKKPLPPPALQDQQQQQKKKPQAVPTKTVALSYQWTRGLGAVIVLVRRPA